MVLVFNDDRYEFEFLMIRQRCRLNEYDFGESKR